MGEVVNLRLARKARDRSAATKAADEARARHGRTKGERIRDETESRRSAHLLAQSRLERPDVDEPAETVLKPDPYK